MGFFMTNKEQKWLTERAFSVILWTPNSQSFPARPQICWRLAPNHNLHSKIQQKFFKKHQLSLAVSFGIFPMAMTAYI